VKFMQRAILILAIAVTLGLSPSAQVQENAPLKIEAAIAPIYPQLAILSATGGDVVVQVKINAGGYITSAKVVDGHKLLREASLNAARRWQFSSGEAGREVQLTFSFRVMPKNTPQIELTPIFKPPYKVEVRRVIPEIPSNSDHGE
jgi:TonB family protein